MFLCTRHGFYNIAAALRQVDGPLGPALILDPSTIVVRAKCHHHLKQLQAACRLPLGPVYTNTAPHNGDPDTWPHALLLRPEQAGSLLIYLLAEVGTYPDLQVAVGEGNPADEEYIAFLDAVVDDAEEELTELPASWHFPAMPPEYADFGAFLAMFMEKHPPNGRSGHSLPHAPKDTGQLRGSKDAQARDNERASEAELRAREADARPIRPRKGAKVKPTKGKAKGSKR